MKTFIFAYKENLGATTDLKEGKFINDPAGDGELGCVVDTKEVEITAEAKQLLSNARKEGGSFAPIMLTRHADGSGSSIGLIGFWKHHFGNEITIGRVCDKSILDDCTLVEREVPEDYKNFIDNK